MLWVMLVDNCREFIEINIKNHFFFDFFYEALLFLFAHFEVLQRAERAYSKSKGLHSLSFVYFAFTLIDLCNFFLFGRSSLFLS